MVYLRECESYGNDYKGKAIYISKPGCNLSTTLISMTLIPKDQREILEFMYKYNPEMYREICNSNG